MKLIEDSICIVLLTFLPDYLLDKLGLYKSMIAIVNNRESEVMRSGTRNAEIQ